MYARSSSDHDVKVGSITQASMLDMIGRDDLDPGSRRFRSKFGTSAKQNKPRSVSGVERLFETTGGSALENGAHDLI